MKRRWPILIALAVVAGGLVWHMFSGLSTEERRLVGRWDFTFNDNGKIFPSIEEYAADRRFQTTLPDGLKCNEAVWSLRDGIVQIDLEPSSIRRLLRPVAPFFGLSVEPISSFTVTFISADRLEGATSTGAKLAWTRIPSD
jgi:hypothetical protein